MGATRVRSRKATVGSEFLTPGNRKQKDTLMSWTTKLALSLALAMTLSACTQISSVLNRKDPVNTLKPTMAVGGSTDAKSNPLLVPPSYPRQSPEAAR